MPITTTYPGVYIQELPSGVHPIQGVATSIAVFIGWAPQGPTTYAQLVTSWTDYSTQFGGLDTRSLLGYAVSHFFMNGGKEAYIIRLTWTDTGTATVTLGTAPDTLTLTAQNPGDWANIYWIGIKNSTANPGRFRLQVISAPPKATSFPVVESFENLGMVSPDPQGRFVVDIVNNNSGIITAAVGAGATTPPDDTPQPVLPAPNPSPMLVGGDPGTPLTPDSANFENTLLPTTNPPTGGVYLLDQVDLFNLLCVPGETTPAILSGLDQYCQGRRAFLIADSDPNVNTFTKARTAYSGGLGAVIPGVNNNAAIYFPWIYAPDPLKQNASTAYPACGFVAGMYATTDANRGVWKAPAGTETSLAGATGVTVPLNDTQNGVLNPVGLNCIRNFRVYGTVIWGARTAQGDDEIGSQWKYVPIRRLALFLEESLYRALQWVVFEPNDAPLWAQIRLNVGAFLQTLFRQGAFQGSTPQQAYFVKCDSETTTPTDQDNGVVNIVVGFAPLKPAEFVIIEIQQMAGQAAT
jgi:phage tail sheath protein FI